MTVAGNYSPGDTVAFHRPYKSLGVEKGEQRRVHGVDQGTGTVYLESPEGDPVAWKPLRVGASRGAVEVYKSEINRAARRGPHPLDEERHRARPGQQPLGGGRRGGQGQRDVPARGRPHAGQCITAIPNCGTWTAPGRPPCMRSRGEPWTTSIAVMEASHPHLSTQKSFYVENQPGRGTGQS